jgi:hypothetical protein
VTVPDLQVPTHNFLYRLSAELPARESRLSAPHTTAGTTPIKAPGRVTLQAERCKHAAAVLRARARGLLFRPRTAGPGISDEPLPARWIETIDLDVHAGGYAGTVLLEDRLVELEVGFMTEPVEEGGDGEALHVDVGGGVAVFEQVERRGLAANASVVARIAITIMNSD